MLCIILALVIILFGAVFSLLAEMQNRNNTYQSLNTLTKQLIESRQLYKTYAETSPGKSDEEVLADYMTLDKDIQMTLEQLKEVVFPHPTVSEIIKETAFAFK